MEKVQEWERSGSAVSSRWSPSSITSTEPVIPASFASASGRGSPRRQRVEMPNIRRRLYGRRPIKIVIRIRETGREWAVRPGNPE